MGESSIRPSLFFQVKVIFVWSKNWMFIVFITGKNLILVMANVSDLAEIKTSKPNLETPYLKSKSQAHAHLGRFSKNQRTYT